MVAVQEKATGVEVPGVEVVEVVAGTDSFVWFDKVYGPVSVPSYTVIDGGDVAMRCSTVAELNNFVKRCHRRDDDERRRILDLIEADKLERRNGTKHNEKALFDNFRQGQHLLHTDTCTLQIRFTNGDSVKYTFNSTDTLKSVREWLCDLRTDGEVPYLFHRNIPRMDYKAEDELKTLAELDLTPRSILMMKPNDTRPRTRVSKKRNRRNSLLKEFIVRLKKCWIDDPEVQVVQDSSQQITPNPLVHRTSTEISNNSSSMVGNTQYNSLLEMNQELDDSSVSNVSAIKFKKSFESNIPSRAESPIAF